MNLVKRIGRLFAKEEPPLPEKSMLDLGPGDICEVELVTYQVTGSVRNPSRNAVVLTLQDGGHIKYLHIEEREKLEYVLYQEVDGRLDNPAEVPTELELDGKIHYLEEEYEGRVMVQGRAPFRQGGEQHVWQFQADDFSLLRIEWQDGRFMLYEGTKVIPGDVQVIRSK
ncbi:DUF4178 domain-containing protein [Paenibacillus physcomitrellae]|uniref:DUF4178 domain-containing protein n=1 Tax=Paenibacillus physcomitrellae TaxID=1619311 RepID=A0ABQ1FQE6_9BACL|nr:DUF4178 domain-containing protein [Paenibacillus physcomitrellae]GGA23825.1 hypothetical protein GCM10010917_05730 [Paenibacillus physcomitrellae]